MIVDFFLEGLGTEAQALSPAALPPGKKRKITLLLIVRNLAIIAFIVAFAYGFFTLFGAENTIIGVTIATTIVTFIKGDMGIRPRQASFLIFYLFLHIGAASYLCHLNPFLGILVNLVSMYLLLTLSGQQMHSKSYLPFLTCYAFAEGMPVTGAMFGQRMLGLAVGGAITAIVYFIFHHKDTVHKRSILDIFKQIHFASTRHRFIVRMTVGMTLAMFIGDIFQLQRPAWITMTVLSLTVPFIHEARKRIVQRVIGNLIGGVVFILLFEFLLPDYLHVWGLLVTGFIYLFLTKYQWQQVFITINSLNGAMIFYSADIAFEMRLLLVAVGIAIVIAINLIARFDLLDRIDIAFRKWRRRHHYRHVMKIQHNK